MKLVLMKSHVKAYSRKTKSGKTVRVRDYDAARKKGTAKPELVVQPDFHWTKTVHTATQGDIGFVRSKGKPIRLVSYTIYQKGRHPIIITHVGAARGATKDPKTKERTEDAVRKLLGGSDVVYPHSEDRFSSEELERHIEQRLNLVQKHMAGSKNIPGIKTARKSIATGQHLEKPGEGYMSKKIEGLGVPFVIEDVKPQLNVEQYSGRKVFRENRLAKLTDEEKILLEFEYEPLVEEISVGMRRECYRQLGYSGISIESSSAEVSSTVQTACWIGLLDAVSKYSEWHKKSNVSFLEFTKRRMWNESFKAMNDFLIPRWTDMKLTLHEKGKKFAFGAKKSVNEAELTVGPPKGKDLSHGDLVNTAFVRPDEAVMAHDSDRIMQQFTEKFYGEAGNRREKEAMIWYFNHGEFSNDAPFEIELRKKVEAKFLAQAKKNPEIVEALQFRSEMDGRAKSVYDTAKTIDRDGEKLGWDMGEFEKVIQRAERDSMMKSEPILFVKAAEERVLTEGKAHIKTFTRHTGGGKMVQVVAHDRRVKKAQYLGKERAHSKAMWHYNYKDKEGEFSHYAPPKGHPHERVYKRDQQRSAAHAGKHGVEVPEGREHDPQAVWDAGEEARQGKAKAKGEKAAARKEKKGKKPVTLETHPDMFTESGELLTRKLPDRKKTKVFINKSADNDFYAKWRDPKLGKWQYSYAVSVRAAKQGVKFKKVRGMAKRIKQIRTAMLNDFQNPHGQGIKAKNWDDIRFMAAVGLIIDHTFMRIGSEPVEAKQERGQDPHFGLLTLQAQHLKFEDYRGKPACVMDYIGKSGQEQRRIVSEPALIDFMKEQAGGKGPTDTVFSLPEGREGNAYDMIQRNFEDRYGVLPKDFRTYHGTRMVREALRKIKTVNNSEEALLHIKAAIEGAASHLGNTFETCRDHYVDPLVVETWQLAVCESSGVKMSKGEETEALGQQGEKGEKKIRTYYIPLDGKGHSDEDNFIDFYHRAEVTDQSDVTDDLKKSSGISGKGLFLQKSHVKAHTRKTKLGKISQVRDYDDSRIKRAKEMSAEEAGNVIIGFSSGRKIRLSEWKDFHGQFTPTKDRLKKILDSGNYSIISAGLNPNDPKEKDMVPNDPFFHKRHEELRRALEKAGKSFTEAEGHYGSQEPTFIVYHHPDKKPVGHHTEGGWNVMMVHHKTDDPSEYIKVRELGRKFNQESVIHCRKGVQEMHFTVGEKSGRFCNGKGYEIVPEAKDYYTEVETGENERTKFTLNFDFKTEHEASEALFKALILQLRQEPELLLKAEKKMSKEDD